jgi:uncharacterized membrane protein YphA (DoxX/SURF4 family)
MQLLYIPPLALLFLRISLASSFWVHGRQKLAMWKMSPNEQMSKKMLNVFKILSVTEPLGAIALLFGFLTQYAALGLFIIMLGALYFKIKVWKKKFSEAGGWEIDLIILAGLFLLLVSGAGRCSLDALFGI